MVNSVYPPFLRPGDTIGVMAPSSYVEREDIEKSAAALEEYGYKVFIHPQTYERQGQSAGTSLQKSLAFQGLWQRKDINTIWLAGGGNRAGQLLGSINFEKLKGAPKNLVGFSDATSLLNAVYKHTEAVTFHAPVFKDLHRHQNFPEILALLGGEKQDCSLDDAQIITPGKARGPLIGGCLSVLQTLIGTEHMPDYKGALLFLEDAGDHLSRFDRMFTHFVNAGLFSDIAGLILGEFHDLQEGKRPFGFMLEEIIAEHADGLDIPVVTNAPFGHGKTLWPFPVGAEAEIDTKSRKISFF